MQIKHSTFRVINFWSNSQIQYKINKLELKYMTSTPSKLDVQTQIIDTNIYMIENLLALDCQNVHRLYILLSFSDRISHQYSNNPWIVVTSTTFFSFSMPTQLPEAR